jgi:outer membrane protein insertion porin family
LLPVLLGSCLGVQHLEEKEKLLYRQRIVAPKNIDLEDVRGLYVQRPNRKILGLPIAPLVGIYYLGYRRYDRESIIQRKKEEKEKWLQAQIDEAKSPERKEKLIKQKQETTERFEDQLNKTALRKKRERKENELQKKIDNAATQKEKDKLIVEKQRLTKRYEDKLNWNKLLVRKERKETKIQVKIDSAKSEKRKENLAFRKQKITDKFADKLENGNTVMQWGEPISVFDSSSVEATVDRFKAYLTSKGYFTNKVDSSVTSIGKFVSVTYRLYPGRPYVLDSIFFGIQDTVIYKLVRETQSESLLKIGEAYDQSKFSKERERLDLLMKDHGFYDFSRQYIEFKTDTSYLSPFRKVMVMIEIKDPARRGYHKQFTIDTVNFVTDAGIDEDLQRQGRVYRDIRYRYHKDDYNLKILSQRVFLKPTEHFSRAKTLDTQRQLANLDAFKFVNINFDTTGGKFTANIFTSPLSRYEWTNEAGVSVTQGYPGPFYNMTFKKRNLFNGMETLDLTGRIGFEGVAPATSDQDFYQSTEAGVNASLTFPQFIWPFRDQVRFRQAQYNPKTKFTAGYAYTDRPEYRRTAVSFNGTYSWNNRRTRVFALTPINLSLIDTANLAQSFKELLAEQEALGNFGLKNSFEPSLVNSLIFSITWNHNNYGNQESNSAFIRSQFESGGTIWNIFDGSFITEKYELQYYQYLRLSVDVRRINVVGRHTTVAYRLNSGLAYAYGANKSLPYEKFFFAGGSNSVRAWRPRRLGPGSLEPTVSTDPSNDGLYDYSVEKPADILIESSIEVRQKLFGFVNGAVFVDAGNVWTFKPRNVVSDDDGNPGSSQFRFDSFFKEIGIGTGFGLRFDFNFLILRFDVGIKVWDPARDEGERFVLDKMKFFGPFSVNREPVIYNVGIGYPF